MAESFPPASQQAQPGLAAKGASSMPIWAAALCAVGSAAIAAWGTQAWMQRQAHAAPGVSPDEQALIELAPTGAGSLHQQAMTHPPAMLYGMLPLHSGHGLRDEQCRRLATDAMKEAGITEIDAGAESALFARQGDYALFVGCHLDQKLILVGAAGPVPEQAESLQEQLLRSLQTRF